MRRSGFTLIEIMVALTIGAAVVLMVHQVFAAVVNAGETIENRRAAFRLEYLSRVQLAAAFASLDVRAAGFTGGPDRVRFTTVANGQPASAELLAQGGRVLLVRAGRTDTLMTALSLRADYLLASGADSRWLMQWNSPASAPVLVRLRLMRDSLRTDTLLLAIGARG